MIRLLALALIITLLAPAVALALGVDLSWSDNATNETNYRIERRDGPDTAAWAVQAVLPANTRSFSQDGLTLGVRYCYAIIAMGPLGEGRLEGCATPETTADPSGLVIIFRR